MSVKMRQYVEKEIAAEAIRCLIANGYSIGVNNGEENVLILLHPADNERSVKSVLKEMFTTDEDYLLALDERGTEVGWIRLIYGNYGWDVISDYSVNLEQVLTAAHEKAREWED